MRRMLFLSLLVLTWVCLSAQAYDRLTGKPFASRSEVLARHGMAATSHPLASQAAIDILKRGGTAVDAALAANAVLALVEPVSCGIGGDLFALVWEAKSAKLHGLNASGRSPFGLTLDYFQERGLTRIPAYGPLPVSVPGCVDGWFELHARFGALSMAEILAPAIDYAREGFPVTEVIAYYWARNVGLLQGFPGFAEVFMPGGRAPAKGEIFRNPRLALTLERIGREGRDLFYRGEFARTIASYVAKQGGFLSYRDMAEHASEWVEPVSASYRGYEVWELPPNGQGIAVLQILNILAGFDLRQAGFGSTEHLHAFIEAKKLAFEDRAKFYADPQFNELPVERLISMDYADARRRLIDPNRAAAAYPAGDAALEGGDTIYLTVADGQGNMVSLIQSNYLGMGSGMTPPGLGFVLQNRGQLFALEAGHFNRFEPHKRPFHTIIPGFMTHQGKPFMSFGVMGGSMQPQGHAQIVMNIVDFGMNLQEAGDAPRIRHGGSSQPTGETMRDGGTVYLESGFSQETVRDLLGMGHRLAQSRGAYGGYQAIRVDAETGVYYGASESRKDGQAIGY
ncbi:MAG: gamma-glutamyltransferase [Planctomycetes bacterium]|nr:gamma-glutamyltransferase [Planctomycetota bacterium]